MKKRAAIILAYLVAFSIALAAGTLIHPYAGVVLAVVLPLLVARYIQRARQGWY